MSYTKEIFENFFNNPINHIKNETMQNNDCSALLERINNLMSVRDEFISKDEECGTLWNEICIDALSAINSAFSGFYRTAIIDLRSIFEMGCNSLYYYDHKIEYYMFKNENAKADKYVSVLVNEHDFYKTKYIKSFKSGYESMLVEEDCVSKYLSKLYGELSDVVHGRYNRLINIQTYEVKYRIDEYKQFEKLFLKTIDIMLVMAILRLDISIENENEIFKNTGVIKYE